MWQGPRIWHDFTALDGELWAVGCRDEGGTLQSCERLDANTIVWVVIHPFFTRLSPVNVLSFDTSKMTKPVVQWFLPQILRRCDLIYMMEIVDKSGTSFPELV